MLVGGPFTQAELVWQIVGCLSGVERERVLKQCRKDVSEFVTLDKLRFYGGRCVSLWNKSRIGRLLLERTGVSFGMSSYSLDELQSLQPFFRFAAGPRRLMECSRWCVENGGGSGGTHGYQALELYEEVLSSLGYSLWWEAKRLGSG